MAFYDTTWYCSSVGYTAVTVRPQNTAVAAGVVRRQFTAPAEQSERCFVCIVAGTTANVTDATWVITRGAKTTDGTAQWQECTGASAVNGDLTNTPSWTSIKGLAISLGQIIKRDNGVSYQICGTAGTAGSGSEPAFSNTAGTTTTDNTVTWISLGAVGNFPAWGAPHARMQAATVTGAVPWFDNGDTLFVAANHNESTFGGTVTLSGAGTVTTPSFILSVDQTAAVPPGAANLLAGATYTQSSPTQIINIAGNGLYIYGVTFTHNAAVSGGQTHRVQNASGPAWLVLDTCKLNFGTSNGAGSTLNIGPTASFTSGAYVEFRNCTYKPTNAGHQILTNWCTFVWKGGGLDAASVSPTILLTGGSVGADGPVLMEGLDLSACTGTLVSRGSFTQSSREVLFKDCKLNAAAIIADVPNGPAGMNVDAIRCDSAGTNYQLSRYRYMGTETTETSVTRVGGATAPDGQAQSRKIVTTADAEWTLPFTAEPYAAWNTLTATNITVTVYGLVAATSSALPNNDDVWIEVEYLGSSTSPQGTIVNTNKTNILATAAAVASDSSVWNNVPYNLVTMFDGTLLNAVLSNGNLTATRLASPVLGGARSTDYKSTGKYYFEVTVVSVGGADSLGILLSTGSFTDLNSSNLNCFVVYDTGNIYGNNVFSTKTLGALANGNVIGVAVDLTARKCWARKGAGNWNGDATHDPATGAGGVVMAATGSFGPAIGFASGGGGGNAKTMNFGLTAYANAAPSGFGNWVTTYVGTPFKLVATLSSPQPAMIGYIEVRVMAAKASTTYYIDPRPVLS